MRVKKMRSRRIKFVITGAFVGGLLGGTGGGIIAATGAEFIFYRHLNEFLDKNLGKGEFVNCTRKDETEDDFAGYAARFVNLTRKNDIADVASNESKGLNYTKNNYTAYLKDEDL